MVRLLCVCLLLTLGVFGCANEAAEAGVTAAQCVQNDLVAQCPPNTTARLEANSAAVCSESTSVGVGITNGDGQIDNVCVGAGSCQLACELVNPCLYGVVSVSPTEGVLCFIPEGGCGDDECAVGEDPIICPQDCAAECMPNTSRCSSGALERCAPNGLLEDLVTCGENQRCVETDATAQCVDNLCGDGTQTEGEACDDGNDINDDACTNACKEPECGDGIVNGIEECDDGDNNNDTIADRCRTSCKSPSCGDDVIDPSNNESCDDGNRVNGDDCTDECIPATCGDGIVDGGEACDDGDDNSNERPDACRANCTAHRCGDRTTDTGERCDDGNTITETCLYGEVGCRVCDENCREIAGETSVCGDGMIDEQAGEQCDDDNTVTEACDYGSMSCTVCGSTCQQVGGITSYCGDDDISNGEACDSGADNGVGQLCTQTCEDARCGDGERLEAVTDVDDLSFEYCDDANAIDINDGCTAACELTEKRENSTPPSNCVEPGSNCRLTNERFPTGECLYEQCYHTNPLPLNGSIDSLRREGMIHGVLTYNRSLPRHQQKDRDVFGFEQVCGYASLEGDRGSDCIGDNSAVYYFTVDYEGGGTNLPFTVQEDCNGVQGDPTSGCSFNIASFCTSESTKTVCDNKPAGKNRAFWCGKANVVGDYRIWLNLQTTASLPYTINVQEQVGISNCVYLERLVGGPVLPGGG